ncbi:hypothetical protein ES695_10380 [Candidatus Atribacteria bacterium 1244-E10-H5-B2]|nr:MAG: hypothetical protein ES695_10380 [Candidatus Atribacteria bacterium 1244-E10-H5-B2]
MLVVGTYKSNAEHFSGLVIARNWKDFTRRISCYFPSVNEVKMKILSGEIIDLPYISLQKDRRTQNIRVKIERRAK